MCTQNHKRQNKIANISDLYRRIAIETGVTVVNVHNIPRNRRKTKRMTRSQEVAHSPEVATVLLAADDVALNILAFAQEQS